MNSLTHYPLNAVTDVDCDSNLVRDYNIDIPKWINQHITVRAIEDIVGNEESVHKIVDSMDMDFVLSNHGGDILEYINDHTTSEVDISCCATFLETTHCIIILALKTWAENTLDVIEEIESDVDRQIPLIKVQWEETKDYIIDEYGKDDAPALNAGFSDLIDFLNKEGLISDYVANSITLEHVEGWL